MIRVSESGRRDSNSQQPAWKAGTLPVELLPQGDYASVNLSMAVRA